MIMSTFSPEDEAMLTPVDLEEANEMSRDEQVEHVRKLISASDFDDEEQERLLYRAIDFIDYGSYLSANRDFMVTPTIVTSHEDNAVRFEIVPEKYQDLVDRDELMIGFVDFTPDNNHTYEPGRRLEYSLRALEEVQDFVRLVELGIIPRPDMMVGYSNEQMLRFGANAGMYTAERWIDVLYQEEVVGDDNDTLVDKVTKILEARGIDENDFGVLLKIAYDLLETKPMDDDDDLDIENEAEIELADTLMRLNEQGRLQLSDSDVNFIQFVARKIRHMDEYAELFKIIVSYSRYTNDAELSDTRAYGFYEDFERAIKDKAPEHIARIKRRLARSKVGS